MIDIYNQVYTKIAEMLEDKYPEAELRDELTFAPNYFPCVCVEEADNYMVNSDNINREHAARVMYEVNIFTNKLSGRRTEARAILSLIDELLVRYNFTRKVTTPLSINENTMYRLFARYEAVVDENNEIYGG